MPSTGTPRSNTAGAARGVSVQNDPVRIGQAQQRVLQINNLDIQLENPGVWLPQIDVTVDGNALWSAPLADGHSSEINCALQGPNGPVYQPPEQLKRVKR